MDRMQAESNARLDRVFDRMDRMLAETNGRFDAMDARFDAVLEAVASFDRRVSRLEGLLEALGAGTE